MSAIDHPRAASIHAETVPLTAIPPDWDGPWAACGARASEPTVFNEGWFLRASARHMAPPENTRLLSVWRGPELLGLMPVCVAPRYGRLPVRHVTNWLHYHAFLGTPLVRAGAEEDFWRGALAALDGADWASAFLHLNGLVEDGPVLAALRRVRRADTVLRSERALLQSTLSPQAYYEATVRKKKRKELGRLKSRLGELGIVAADHLGPDGDVDAWIDDFLALEASGWKGRAGSALADHPETRAFFTEIVRAAHRLGKLEILRLTLDGKPMAMLVNFLSPPGSFSYKIAFDEDFARFSPGVLIQIENLAILERPGIAWMDSCAVADHAMINSLWGERRAMARVTVPLKGPVRRMRFSHSPHARACCGVGEADAMTIFTNLAGFAALYPETPGKVEHGFAGHPAFTLDGLAALALRLDPAMVEYNRGNLPVGVDPGDAIGNGLSIAETIRGIETNGSWMVLKYIERDAEFARILDAALDEIVPVVTRATGAMLKREGFIFLSSPNSVTPFHFDPEHNILLQLRGTKTMTVFPADDEAIVGPQEHERYHRGGHRNTPWRDEFASKGRAFDLAPGEGIYVPVKAPHWVKNGPTVSISLSVTWRSEWSYAEADARGLNALLRQAGLSPASPGRFPAQNRAKALAYRAARRLGIR